MPSHRIFIRGLQINIGNSSRSQEVKKDSAFPQHPAVPKRCLRARERALPDDSQVSVDTRSVTEDRNCSSVSSWGGGGLQEKA